VLWAVGIILSLVGAVALFSTLALSVLERQREIGILRSMGAVGTSVTRVFLTEGVLTGLIGWVLGALVGLPASYELVRLLDQLVISVPYSFSAAVLPIMLALMLLLVSVACAIPVWRATRLSTAQALRYE
jgi:putative ABC transport system permease protein